MRVITAIKAFFNNWVYPIFLFATTLFLLIASGFDNSHSGYFQNTAGIIVGFGALVLIISTCYQFSKKQWKKGLASIVVLVGGGIFASLLFLVIATAVPMIDGDHWADDLIIPKNIQIENPVNGGSYFRPDSILKLNKSEMDLVLYKSGEPGMYQYDFWTGEVESGTIYLKAFEITQEEELSVESIKQHTTIAINNPADRIIKFGSTKDFTIYEGDWGKFYAARFEVWFNPSSGKQERKLFQKNFKVEGWMH